MNIQLLLRTNLCKWFVSAILILLPYASWSQVTPRKVTLPNIPDYITLKCDLHMHTVFSDGYVWPTFRVNEAIRDGLDAISLTEHIDLVKASDDIKRDLNRSYEIAVEAAQGKNLLIIPGVEISPRTPPYHNNALFIKDANSFPYAYMKSAEKEFVMKDAPTQAELMGPFLEAQKQGAFVVYNHPGYNRFWDKKDTALFTSFHEDLLRRKILKGVEVVNSANYNIIAHRMAMKYDLTMVCNTDEHYDMFPRYHDTHRPMTLVFAKSRTVEAIREALENKRTALYFGDYIVARKREAEPFFKSSLKINAERKVRNTGEHVLEIRIANASDIPYQVKFGADYDIEAYPMRQVVLKAHETTTVFLKAVWKWPQEVTLSAEVANILVSPDEPLRTELVIATR